MGAVIRGLSDIDTAVKLAIHYIRKNNSTSKGSIVCTSSNAGLHPFPIAPMYATSKHAIVGAVR
jgi:NAD(P)-dependent dehydrogenase (short-subunit alcohol dehydrogenase family)